MDTQENKGVDALEEGENLLAELVKKGDKSHRDIISGSRNE